MSKTEANQSRISLVDVTAVPRITIAQKLDVLSSQAKVAGHRAVVEVGSREAEFSELWKGSLCLPAVSHCRDDCCGQVSPVPDLRSGLRRGGPGSHWHVKGDGLGGKGMGRA